MKWCTIYVRFTFLLTKTVVNLAAVTCLNWRSKRTCVSTYCPCFTRNIIKYGLTCWTYHIFKQHSVISNVIPVTAEEVHLHWGFPACLFATVNGSDEKHINGFQCIFEGNFNWIAVVFESHHHGPLFLIYSFWSFLIIVLGLKFGGGGSYCISVRKIIDKLL